MYLSIIFLPLLGSTVSGFFGRKSGITGSHIISSSSVVITTILAIIAFFEVGFNNNTVSISLFDWLVSESFNIVWNFQFDSLTVSMLIPVLVISSLVHIYSIGYMSSDPHNQRFFSYLNLFTFMMILLVTGNNYLLMFVGWEGVGVCSYLLVSFWFTRIAANQSSISAFLTNRVGDCFLLIGMLGLLWTLGNLDYSTIFSLAPYINTNVVTIIGICLLIGAMAKSAQIGLHIWLPMAMEGPTPVSALIHAATMVTAGVYLLIRSSPLIEYSSTLLLICLWLGAITTLSSSMIGLFQGDIKKIIAYSTMSQLGMMVVAIGLSSYNVALFHLINHAFYKGLLFLGAGAVIHAVSDNQDLRKYGGLIHWLPLSYSVILIASLSLVAFPFMTGFYSKDLILESSYGQYHFPSIAVYFIAVIGAIFTTLYSVKVLYLTFIANPNGSLNYYKNAHEGNIYMSLPLIILAIFSIYFGFLTKDIYVGLGSGFFNNNSIFIHPLHEILISAEFGLSAIIKLLPFILTVIATGFAIVLFEFYPSLTNKFKLSNLGYNIFGFFNQRLLIELFVNKYIVELTLRLGGQTTKILDRGSIELIGPFGAEKLLLSTGKLINSLSTGMVTNYALYIIIGIIVYLMGNNFYLFDINNTLLLSMLCINIFIVILSSKRRNIPSLVLESSIFNSIKWILIQVWYILAMHITPSNIWKCWLFFIVMSRIPWIFYNFKYNINISDLNELDYNSVSYGLNDVFEHFSASYNSNHLLLGLPTEPLKTPENTSEEITYNSSSSGSNNSSSFGSNNSPSSGSNNYYGNPMDIEFLLNPVTEVPNQGNWNPSGHPQTPNQPSEHPQTPSRDPQTPNRDPQTPNQPICSPNEDGVPNSRGHFEKWYLTPEPYSPGHIGFWDRLNNTYPSPPSYVGSAEGSPNPDNGEGPSRPRTRRWWMNGSPSSDNGGEGSSGSKRPYDGSGEGSSGSKRPKN